MPKSDQVENGSVGELINVVTETVPKVAVPPGRVLACGSASHLAAVGFSANGEDFVEASRNIFGRFPGRGNFHARSFVLGGVEDPPPLKVADQHSRVG
jgi:hypothetical protein